jgi:hypothetical protein
MSKRSDGDLLTIVAIVVLLLAVSRRRTAGAVVGPIGEVRCPDGSPWPCG